MSTAVYRGKVLTNSGLLDDALVVTLRDRISDIRPAGDYNGPATTAEYILPGLIDLHNHGGAGEGFPTSTLNGCRRAARHHRAHGTTTLLASLVSAPGDHLVEQTALLADLADEGEIDGVHMEGPFVNSVRCGAQDPAAIIPGDPELFERVAKAGRGWLKTITFAPETANVDGLLRVCATYDVVASLGHTDADFDTTLSVIDRPTCSMPCPSCITVPPARLLPLSMPPRWNASSLNWSPTACILTIALSMWCGTPWARPIHSLLLTRWQQQE